MNKKRLLNIIILIIWMSFIFVMSSFDAEDSGNQSGMIVSLLTRFINIGNLNFLSVFIRKLAHFTEYFVLGLLSLNCIKDYSLKREILYSIIFTIVYAITDEFHQTFVPGRAGLFTDVLIDSFGAIVGIIIYKKIKLKRFSYEK